MYKFKSNMKEFNNAICILVTMWKYYENLYVLSNPPRKHEQKKIDVQLYLLKWFLAL